MKETRGYRDGTSAVFEKDGRTEESWSNKTYFVAETGKGEWFRRENATRNLYKYLIIVMNMEYQTQNVNKEILVRLTKLQSDMEYIKEHMVDVDTILTIEEEEALEESLKELKGGKTISHKELKKELGL